MEKETIKVTIPKKEAIEAIKDKRAKIVKCKKIVKK